MTAQAPLTVYSDYKSPYAYLVKDLVDELVADTGVTVDWLPYTLDIPSYLGDAKVDADGNIIAQNRNAHQWRRVKYSYMDCRREANRRGLTIRGPKKIFDSSLANIGLLFAKRAGVFPAYNAMVFERFWRRELDIEDAAAVAGVLEAAGTDASTFHAYAAGEGRQHLHDIQSDAESKGVFGVPSFLFSNGDLYWGREHLSRVRELIDEAGL